VIQRNYLGLDLQPQAMRAVSLRRSNKGMTLVGGRILGMEEGVIVPSFRNPNIKNITRFVDNLHELLDPLAAGEERIALALPEQCGIVLLEEVEAVLKSKREGVEVLRWQLRDKLPADVDLQLDYQTLSRDESGRQKVLIAAMAYDVLHQYEEVINQAGFGAELIGFRSMALYNYYRPRVELGENCVIIQVEDEHLGFQVYQGGLLVFQRSRVVGTEIENIYREINRSLAGETGNLPGLNRANVFLHSNRENPGELIEMMQSLFVQVPVLLHPAVERMSAAPLLLNDRQAVSLATAVGAAERLI